MHIRDNNNCKNKKNAVEKLFIKFVISVVIFCQRAAHDRHIRMLAASKRKVHSQDRYVDMLQLTTSD